MKITLNDIDNALSQWEKAQDGDHLDKIDAGENLHELLDKVLMHMQMTGLDSLEN